MSAKMWEVTVEHARTCVLDKRVFVHCPPNSQQKAGVVFNIVGQVLGLLSESQYVPIEKLSETEKAFSYHLKYAFLFFTPLFVSHFFISLVLSFVKLCMQADAHNLIIYAFEHWGEVVSFEDEASLTGGSSHFTNVLYSPSSPKAESSTGSKFLASQKIGGFDYTQPSASSPDIISSIYSVGATSGLDDFSLHSIDSMGLRYDQTLSFASQVTNSLICDTEPMAQAFCDDLQFFDADLQSQNISLESQADLQSAVDGFLLTRSTAVAIVKAQRRWRKLFSVLKWFSIRRTVALKRTRTREIKRF